MRVPIDADPDIQAAFRTVWEHLDSLEKADVDLKRLGRVRNALNSSQPGDYVTRRELHETIEFMKGLLEQNSKVLRQELG